MLKEELKEADYKATEILNALEDNGYIVEGKTELQLKQDFVNLASQLFNIKKYWHKKIVRVGKNTLHPYKENPANLSLKDDDIVFLDFGPVFGNIETDIGKTYVLGQDKTKLQIKMDAESAWLEGKDFYEKNKKHLTGSDFYYYTRNLAAKYGWEYGNSYCGHLIGEFPHEKSLGEDIINYIHPENNQLMAAMDKFGNERFWIYEIHFVDKKLEIGAFYEKILL